MALLRNLRDRFGPMIGIGQSRETIAEHNANSAVARYQKALLEAQAVVSSGQGAIKSMLVSTNDRITAESADVYIRNSQTAWINLGQNEISTSAKANLLSRIIESAKHHLRKEGAHLTDAQNQPAASHFQTEAEKIAQEGEALVKAVENDLERLNLSSLYDQAKQASQGVPSAKESLEALFSESIGVNNQVFGMVDAVDERVGYLHEQHEKMLEGWEAARSDIESATQEIETLGVKPDVLEAIAPASQNIEAGPVDRTTHVENQKLVMEAADQLKPFPESLKHESEYLKEYIHQMEHQMTHVRKGNFGKDKETKSKYWKQCQSLIASASDQIEKNERDRSPTQDSMSISF